MESGGGIAKYLLERIYHLCNVIFENLDSLAEKYPQIKKELNICKR